MVAAVAVAVAVVVAVATAVVDFLVVHFPSSAATRLLVGAVAAQIPQLLHWVVRHRWLMEALARRGSAAGNVLPAANYGKERWVQAWANAEIGLKMMQIQLQLRENIW